MLRERRTSSRSVGNVEALCREFSANSRVRCSNTSRSLCRSCQLRRQHLKQHRIREYGMRHGMEAVRHVRSATLLQLRLAMHEEESRRQAATLRSTTINNNNNSRGLRPAIYRHGVNPRA